MRSQNALDVASMQPVCSLMKGYDWKTLVQINYGSVSEDAGGLYLWVQSVGRRCSPLEALSSWPKRPADSFGSEVSISWLRETGEADLATGETVLLVDLL